MQDARVPSWLYWRPKWVVCKHLGSLLRKYSPKVWDCNASRAKNAGEIAIALTSSTGSANIYASDRSKWRCPTRLVKRKRPTVRWGRLDLTAFTT